MVEFILVSCVVCLVIVSYNIHKEYKRNWGENY